MGNQTSSNYFYSNSSLEGVISEHLEVLSTCINRDTIKKNKTNGQLFGLVEKDEDAINTAALGFSISSILSLKSISFGGFLFS